MIILGGEIFCFEQPSTKKKKEEIKREYINSLFLIYMLSKI